MAPGWYPDPTGRFEHRYHNGSAWTGDVAVDGHRRVDLTGTGPTPPSDSSSARPPPVRRDADDPRPGNRLATAALVLAIIGVVLGWLPFVAFLMIPVVIVAGALAAAARRQAVRTGVGGGRATAAMVLAPLGLVAVVAGLLLTDWMTGAIQRYDRPARHAADVTRCGVADTRIVAEGTLTNSSARASSFTIRLELVVDGVERQRLVELDDVAPGDTTTWRAAARTEADADDADADSTCVIVDVHGPLPLGIDPGR